VRIGAVFPQTEIGSDPGALRAFAEAVEALGYQHLQVYDHVIGADPATRPGWSGYTIDDAFLEVFVLYGYLAAVTRTIELVVGVLILPQRQTVLVAKQAATLDVLSGGRLRLGVGIGWNAVEYQALNEEWHTRGARSEEQVEAAGIKPLPLQQPIPIWFGGSADAVLRRTARIGDGWISSGAPDGTTAEKLQRLRAYTADAGRSPDALGIDGHLTMSEATEDRWPEVAAAWRALGATHLSVQTMGCGFTRVDQHIEALQRCAAALEIRPA
jgi:alkanesulfonate monooxygenase SsuD/methylene tetrahydromethanopterin reductase-like flavin-dependent oxidoreductase (luciferase family)